MDKLHKVGDWLFPLDDSPLDVGLLSTDIGTFVGFTMTDTDKKTHRVAFPPSLAAQIGKALVMTAVEATKEDAEEPDEAPSHVVGMQKKKDWVN